VGYKISLLVPRRESQPAVTSLHPRANWVAGLTNGLKEVMNAESLELQAIFKSDHMVSHATQGHLSRCRSCHCIPLTCKPLYCRTAQMLYRQLSCRSVRLLMCLQFAALVKNDFISDLRCFYDADSHSLHSIVQLGRYNLFNFSHQKLLLHGMSDGLRILLEGDVWHPLL
jgi:hypothetical protein